MKPIVMVRVWTESSLVSISGPEKKTVTHGRSYKLDLLNSLKSCRKLVGLVRKQIEVSLVPVSDFEVKILTRGILYKFSILKITKINTLWEPFHHFILAYQNLMKTIELERGNPRIP